MGFTNRWVCMINLESISPKDIRSKEGIIHEEKGEAFDLRTVVKFDPPIKGEDEQIKYLTGKLYYQWEDKVKDFSISIEQAGDKAEDGKRGIQLVETMQTVRRTSIVDFWMAFNRNRKYILFKNSKIGEAGLMNLSKLLFGDPSVIKPVEFDIQKIETDVKNGLFEGMWAFYFNGRKGSITKGALYADITVDIEDDNMYKEAASAPKNFIGLIVELSINGKSEKVKLRVSRKGTVTIYRDLDSIDYLDTIFDVIELFEGYII